MWFPSEKSMGLSALSDFPFLGCGMKPVNLLTVA